MGGHGPAARPERPTKRVARRKPSRAPVRPGGSDESRSGTDEEWQKMVATAAYYRSQARRMEGGSPEDDWYQAEAELRERFGAAESQVEGLSDSGGETTDIEKGE